MSLPKLNYKHINKIVKHISGNVKRLYMPTWGLRKGTEAAKTRLLKAARFPECNTVACFAGWSKLLSIPEKKWKSIFHLSGIMWSYSRRSGISVPSSERDRLGLTECEASDLFESTYGSPSDQFKVVKSRLRNLVANRIAAGDMDAKKIKL